MMLGRRLATEQSGARTVDSCVPGRGCGSRLVRHSDGSRSPGRARRKRRKRTHGGRLRTQVTNLRYRIGGRRPIRHTGGSRSPGCARQTRRKRTHGGRLRTQVTNLRYRIGGRRPIRHTGGSRSPGCARQTRRKRTHGGRLWTQVTNLRYRIGGGGRSVTPAESRVCEPEEKADFVPPSEVVPAREGRLAIPASV